MSSSTVQGLLSEILAPEIGNSDQDDEEYMRTIISVMPKHVGVQIESHFTLKTLQSHFTLKTLQGLHDLIVRYC
jgi:hypothetical protein